MERKLASVQRIREIRPIDGADSIELAVINNWQVVVAKSVEHKVGDLIVYCEIDSFLPIREEFEFLRKTSYKKMADGSEGFRLKTIKLRGQISQGLVLPIHVLDGPDEMKVGLSKQPWGDQLQLGPYDDALVLDEGVDVTSILGIVKYDPPMPAQLAGKAKGYFPSFINKTDEERIQNLTAGYIELENRGYYVTEKLDGSSATYYFRNGEFGVCSRNLELIEEPDNSFWRIARELKIEEKLGSLEENLAIQGELIGEGIQGNPYKIKGQDLRIFSMFNIDTQRYLSLDEMHQVLKKMNVDSNPLQLVPILNYDYKLPNTIDEILMQADGKSVLNKETDREGIVIRNSDRSVSFKAISNKFLLNEK